MAKHFDVIVIGSGPSGSMAAIEASKQGLHTALIEKEKLPRRKVCAGGLVKRASDLIPADIEYPIQSDCHEIGLVISDANLSFQPLKRDNLVTMVCRSAFDYALIKHAAKLGCEIIDECNIDTITPEEEYNHIQSSKGDFSCSYLVFADGAKASLSNKFWDDNRQIAPSIEADIYLSDEKMKEFQQHATFDFGAISQGYGWVFPKSDHLSIGLATFNKNGVRLQKQLDKYLQQLRIFDDSEIKNRKGFIIPLTARDGPFVKKRMLIVGDAAGFVDPITAEGLSHAIRSGQEAGRAIVSGFSDPKHVLTVYQDAIKKHTRICLYL